MLFNSKARRVESKMSGLSALALLAVIAGLVVISASGFWAYQGYAAAPVAEEELVEEAQEVDTSNRQTYRNEEFGFEVRYPSNHILLVDGAGVLFELQS